MLQSMTGYGEAQLEDEGISFVVEIKSLNNRFLKTVIKLPDALAFVEPDHAEKLVAVMKEDRYGREASIIGEVISENPGTVSMKTRIGGARIIHMLTGEQLPRIC